MNTSLLVAESLTNKDVFISFIEINNSTQLTHKKRSFSFLNASLKEPRGTQNSHRNHSTTNYQANNNINTQANMNATNNQANNDANTQANMNATNNQANQNTGEVCGGREDDDDSIQDEESKQSSEDDDMTSVQQWWQQSQIVRAFLRHQCWTRRQQRLRTISLAL